MPRNLLRFYPVFLLACGHGREASSSDSAAPTDAGGARIESAVPVASSTAKTSCPRTGLWAQCSLEKRLTQSGFVVNRVKEPERRRAGFSVRPAIYKLGRSRLEVFIYQDSAAARRDIAKLDTLTASPRDAPSEWGMVPTLVRSANLLAVFLTDSPQQAERLTLALTAGAPQP